MWAIVLFLICFAGLTIAHLRNKRDYTFPEYGLSIAIVIVLVAMAYFAAGYAETQDTEILSGKVLSKHRETVSCSHSYDCNCRRRCSGSGKNRSCYQECDTCYRHTHDYDWDVGTTIGDITIDRVDSQGIREPQRWTNVIIGEPVSSTHWYRNWLKAVPDSVLRTDMPPSNITYPNAVFDYYRINRLVVDGVDIPDPTKQSINNKISQALIDRGKAKQVNIVIVVTNRPSAFAQQLKGEWINGKKNDQIVVVGVSSFPHIDWVEAFGWSANDMINIKIRDDIRQYGTLDETIVDIIASNIDKYWIRKPMAEFAYLAEEIQPSGWTLVIVITLVGLAVSGMIFVFINKEVL